MVAQEQRAAYEALVDARPDVPIEAGAASADTRTEAPAEATRG